MQPSVSACQHPVPDRDSETRHILSAAWWVLERSRFRSLKVRQVLAESRTSASNFYRRFPSKAHLLLALLEDEVQLVEQQLRERIDPDAPVAEQLRAWLHYNIGILYNQRRAQRTRLFLDPDLMDVLPDEVTALFNVGDRHLAEIVRRGIATGDLRVADPETAAMLVGQLIRGLLTSGGGLPEDRDELVRSVHGFVLRALDHR
ncbi:TetR/AcrR family transcriptional regulator [Rhodococcus sp. B50]|uniref:TetR/AcrR family transcriptional regulator n=1 Tax=Rhodococcus sp. B50 TaxID=2682847 RepID=UPI0019E7723B|nr:TetR/AcrR family transcriptional regulator [Rhodococcus sp. B50]MBS9376428.1 hypothetical protein [Rhodococcus sp. B50]